MNRTICLEKSGGGCPLPLGDCCYAAASKCVSLVRLAIVAALFVATPAAPVFAESQSPTLSDLRVEVASMKSFDNTIKHLKWRFGEHGLVIAWASNYAEVVNQDSIQVRNAVIFEVLQQKWLKSILDYEPSAALAMPIRIMITETMAGETLVSYQRPSVLLLASKSEEIKVLGKTIDNKLARIIRLAASE
jgi:uncharacterized protein (DUF302 family)